jgi:sec-independent protein translocase protein TatA
MMWWHWVLVAAAFILLFGAKKLPDAARGLGRSLRILKSEVSAMHDDDDKPVKAPAETDASAAVATPVTQIAATPVTPQVPAAQGPAAQPQQATVVNGVPVSTSEQQPT